MTMASALHPFRPFRRRHLVLLRQVASIYHRQLDQSTALGFFWSFLNPLLTLVVLWVFFSRRESDRVSHYAVHLLVGIVLFTHFSKSTSSAMRVIHRMRSLATNVIFPKDVLVYSVLLADTPEFLVSIGLTTIVAMLSGVALTWPMLALPVVLAGHMALILWTSMVLSMIYVFVRDLDHLFEVGMRLLFFVTPIIYSLDSLSPSLRRIARLNPLGQSIELVRTLLIDGQWPPAESVLSFLIVNFALAYASIVLFRVAEPTLLERL